MTGRGKPNEFSRAKRFARRSGKVFLVVIVVLAIFLAGGFVYEKTSEARDDALFPAPGEVFRIDGRNLHLNCTGSGPMTVILEAGGATPSTVWWQVQEQIAKFAHVCSHDRAGFGWSDPSPNDLSFEDGSKDLKQLLEAAEIPGPYILVGHSKGGLHVRTFARLYPDTVAGVLLLDASEEEHLFSQLELLESIALESRGPGLLASVGIVRLLLRFSPASVGVPENVPDVIAPALLSQLARPGQFEQGYREVAAYRLTPGEMRVAGGFGRLGDVPLIVITHGIPFTGGQARTTPGWMEGQQRLASLSTNSELLVAKHSGHAIFWDEPELVVDSVRRLISEWPNRTQMKSHAEHESPE